MINYLSTIKHGPPTPSDLEWTDWLHFPERKYWWAGSRVQTRTLNEGHRKLKVKFTGSRNFHHSSLFDVDKLGGYLFVARELGRQTFLNILCDYFWSIIGIRENRTNFKTYLNRISA